jgi:hypothetical protein
VHKVLGSICSTKTNKQENRENQEYLYELRQELYIKLDLRKWLSILPLPSLGRKPGHPEAREGQDSLQIPGPLVSGLKGPARYH